MKKVRKGSPDKIYEDQLHEVMTHDNDQPILEAAMNNATNTLNELRAKKEALPLQDYAISCDVKREKDFKEADNVGKKDRNTELWDKYIGVQLDNEKTVITNNIQPSQLLSNNDTREDMFKKNKTTKSASDMTDLMDADAMLYHIYRSADGRDLTKQEQQQVNDINSGKIRILAQFGDPVDIDGPLLSMPSGF